MEKNLLTDKLSLEEIAELAEEMLPNIKDIKEGIKHDSWLYGKGQYNQEAENIIDNLRASGYGKLKKVDTRNLSREELEHYDSIPWMFFSLYDVVSQRVDCYEDTLTGDFKLTTKINVPNDYDKESFKGKLEEELKNKAFMRGSKATVKNIKKTEKCVQIEMDLVSDYNFRYANAFEFAIEQAAKKTYEQNKEKIN